MTVKKTVKEVLPVFDYEFMISRKMKRTKRFVFFFSDEFMLVDTTSVTYFAYAPDEDYSTAKFISDTKVKTNKRIMDLDSFTSGKQKMKILGQDYYNELMYEILFGD